MVIWETIRTWAVVWRIKRGGNGLHVRRSVVEGARQLEAEAKARPEEGMGSRWRVQTKIQESRAAGDAERIAFWREAMIYLDYLDSFYKRPEKPDVKIIEG